MTFMVNNVYAAFFYISIVSRTAEHPDYRAVQARMHENF